MEPIQIIFEKVSVEEKFVENITKSISATKDCNNSSERIVLNQALKNHEVELFISVKMAKGVIRINTFKITYLSEYVNNRFNRFIETKLLRMPSKEKTFRLLESTVTILFSLNISSEKLILQLKICSPISLIAREIKEFIFINCSIKKYDELANMA